MTRSAASQRAAGVGSRNPGAGGGRVISLPSPQGQIAGVSGTSWFGPGSPPAPSAPADVAGRQWDFPSGYNNLQTPRAYEQITFGDLRGLADGYDILRIIIETRKDQMSRLQWSFVPVDEKAEMTPELEGRVRRYTMMLRRPDGRKFWKEWLRSVLEDLLVIDAPTIHKRRTLGGELISLDQIDGATVKVVLDDWGRTPEPPFAAYQQVLHGMPAVNYSTSDLIYAPRNVRVHKAYGYSPVEQIIMTVNIALRRQMWQLAYFTDGNIPDSLIGVPSTWSPDQIRQFQDWFDMLLSGNTERRRGATFVPGEVAKSYIPTKEAEMFGHAEEWLARVVCFCMGVSHQPFVKENNRATAQTSADQALTDGLAPIMEWVKGTIDGLLLDEFQEEELEFRWNDDKEMDPKVQSEIIDTYVKDGMLTRNEGREMLGLEPDRSPEADMLMITTPTGPVPLSNEEAIKIKKANLDAFPPPPPVAGALPGPGQSAAGGSGVAPGPKPGAAPASSPRAQEAAAKSARPFGVEKGGRPPADLTPGTVTRPACRRAQRTLSTALETVLQRVGARVAAQVTTALDRRGVTKADTPDQPDPTNPPPHEIDMIVSDLDLDMTDVITTASGELEAIFADAGRIGLATIGVDDQSSLVDQVSERAVRYATDRSAELVGKRVLDDGRIIDNPDARWAIDQSTRDMVRETISSGLRDNDGSDAIRAELEDSYAFSPARAEMISRTEIAEANSQGAMESYRVAEESGVVVQKQWILGAAPCDICQGNADQGPIDLDEDFESGDDATPAHPNCECATVPVVLSDVGGAGDEEEDVS